MVSVVGNNYGAYNGSELEGYFYLSHEVPCLIDVGLRALYFLSVRNFIVSSLLPLLYVPLKILLSGYAECEKNATVDVVVASHNHFLGNRLKNITRDLENLSVLYLQQTKAMKFIINHPWEFNLTQGFKPCCEGQCGSVDGNGDPLFNVCDNPAEIETTSLGSKLTSQVFCSDPQMVQPNNLAVAYVAENYNYDFRPNALQICSPSLAVHHYQANILS